MKKALKYSILILLFVCTISLCGCGHFYAKTHQSGIYKYEDLGKECILVGINGCFNKLEAIEIPDYIDGRKVTSIYAGDVKVKSVEHDYVKSLYIGNTIESMHVFANHPLFACKNLNKIVINNLNLPNMAFGLNSVAENCVIAVSQESFAKELEAREKSELNYGWIKGYSIVLANIEYHYNYENSSNGGYYRIDYVRNADEIPYRFAEPTRDGYIFDGWYLEPECQTQWDNTTCKLFEEPVITQIYQDTSYKEVEMATNKLQLYAKWNKN